MKGEGRSFHIRLEERKMKEPNSSHKGPSSGRVSLGDTHVTETLHEGMHFFMSPGFSSDNIVVHITLYLKCRKVQNNFSLVVYYAGGGKENTSFVYSLNE